MMYEPLLYYNYPLFAKVAITITLLTISTCYEIFSVKLSGIGFNSVPLPIVHDFGYLKD